MHVFSVLRNGRYLNFFIGSTISKLGDWFFTVSLPLLVYQLTKSATGMALTFVLEILPQVLFALLGGALADQINKKKMLVCGDFASAVIVSIIPVMYYLGRLETWMVYVVAFLLASITAFYHPSFESIIPEIVDREELIQGNSLFRFTDTIMTFVGPAVAGVAISIFGKVNTIFIDGVSFLLTALILSRIKYVFQKKLVERPKIIDPIKEGIRYVVSNNKILSGSLLIFGINIGFGAVESLFMFFLADNLKMSSSEIGIVLGVQALGPFIAVYLANRLKKIDRGHVIIYSGFLIGIAQMLLILSKSYMFALMICQVVMQGATTLLAINWFTLRQEVVPSELLGRVISSTRMISYLAVPISGMIAGILANSISVPTIFTISGVLVVICSLLGMRTSLFSRKLNISESVKMK